MVSDMKGKASKNEIGNFQQIEGQNNRVKVKR
jgi:hypothetical protein